MEQAGSEVHILVAPGVSASGPDPVEVLGCLGPDARIAIADAEACVGRAREGSVDLIVLDDREGRGCAELLERLEALGTPVVVLHPAGSEGAAVEAFRRGAADCVAAGDDLDETLPLVALEQIHRAREGRERGLAERRIRDLERSNENIIQNLNSALLVVDPEGRIAFSNPPAEDVLGERELAGRLLWDWFPGVDRDEIPVGRTLRSGERFKGRESSITRSDGSSVPIGLSCAPVLDDRGERVGAVVVFSDLTEIKQLQRQVLQTEKMASIGQLAAGVAHEINNPMGFIHANLFQMAEYLADLRRVWSYVDAVQKAAATGDIADIRAAADDLDSAAREVDVAFLLSDLAQAIRESQEGSERIRHIVADLRDFSHSDNEQAAAADVNQCLDSTANIVWPMMKHLVELERDYGELPAIVAYPMQLKQVFMNLLVNAFQAIEEKVGDSGRTGRIGLRTETRRDEVVVTIEDSGAGIEPEAIDRIFDPFFTTKKVGSGTGLGLATCFNIVERHGGRIRVDSEPGKGATFRVLLPLRVPDPGPEDGG